MIKYLFLFSSFYSLYVHSLEVAWLGTTSFIIKEKKTLLLIDPSITRPSITNLWGLLPFSTNEKLVDLTLKKMKIDKIDAILVSHTHFDHAQDLGYISSKFPKTKVIGSSSAHQLAKAYNPHFKNFHNATIKLDSKVELKDISIQIFQGTHHVFGGFYHFAPGDIEVPMKKGSIFDFKMGGAFDFLIKTKNKSILFLGEFKESLIKNNQVDYLIFSTTNVNHQDFEKAVNNKDFKGIIPAHWDNFFTSRDLENTKLLPFKINDYKKFFKSKNLSKKLLVPRYFEYIEL